MHLERVLKDIEKVKNNLTIKNESKALQEELKKARDDKVKAIAKKQVDQRKVYEHGVLPKETSAKRPFSLEPRGIAADQEPEKEDGSIKHVKLVRPKDLDLSEIAIEETRSFDEQRLIVPPTLQ